MNDTMHMPLPACWCSCVCCIDLPNVVAGREAVKKTSVFCLIVVA